MAYRTPSSPDISELDRAGGRVNLRKSFVRWPRMTPTPTSGPTSSWPSRRRTSARQRHAVSTKKTFDTREQAQTRIEAYLNKGPEWAGYLFENHIAGQRVIQLFQRLERRRPQRRPDPRPDRERRTAHAEGAVHPRHRRVGGRAQLHLQHRPGLQGGGRHRRHQRRAAL